MRFTIQEKIALIILAILLCIGSAVLYSKEARPYCRIIIEENGIREEFTLKEIEARLKERRKIDINTAACKEITAIDGIGEVLAGRIVRYRDTHGAFYSEKDLLKVEGIGQKKFEKIREYVRF